MLLQILFLLSIILFVFCFFKKNNNKSNIISIGIPCIPKHIIHLNELINNINKQKLLPYEIIISLSESNENEGIKLEKKLNKLSKVNVRVITSQKKQYAGENRNVCGKHCNTELISFIDSDDLMCSKRIYILEDLYKKYNYDVLFHNFSDGNISKCSNNYNIVNDKNETKKQYESNNNKNKNDSVYLQNVAHGHLTIKTNILNNYPIDINGYGEDTRYLHTLFENNLNIISLPDYKGTLYRIENSSWS